MNILTLEYLTRNTGKQHAIRTLAYFIDSLNGWLDYFENRDNMISCEMVFTAINLR